MEAVNEIREKRATLPRTKESIFKFRCVEIGNLHLKLNRARWMRSLFRRAGGWECEASRCFQRTIREIYGVPLKLVVLNMKRRRIDDNVAGQIISLPIGVMNDDGSGESVATGGHDRVAGGICRRGLRRVSRCEIGR